MDLVKKFLPKQKTIQTLKVDAQGFRKNINENPPTQEFFKNPPDGAEHDQKCIKSKNRRHFEKPTFWDIQLCCLAQKDSSPPKVLNLHFVSVKHGSASI